MHTSEFRWWRGMKGFDCIITNGSSTSNNRSNNNRSSNNSSSFRSRQKSEAATQGFQNRLFLSTISVRTFRGPSLQLLLAQCMLPEKHDESTILQKYIFSYTMYVYTKLEQQLLWLYSLPCLPTPPVHTTATSRSFQATRKEIEISERQENIHIEESRL